MSNDVVSYLCIDDDEAGRNALIEDLARPGKLEFKSSGPTGDIDAQISEITKADVDGVLLDYVLRVKGGSSQPERISNSLAQQMRDNATLGLAADIPVVLWSSAKNFRDYYQHDTTAQDLYDLRVDKTKLEEQAEMISAKLVALAEGYHAISEHKENGRDGLINMLGISSEQAKDFLDPRVGDSFSIDKKRPEHEYARYIIHEILSEPSPLVDEQLLAARLGIDFAKSEAETLKELFGRLSEFEYRGVFSSGWMRWWWQPVFDWWVSNCGTENLQEMPAEERVRILKEKTGMSFVEPGAIDEGYSTAFWTICEVYRQPLDPTNGFQSSNSSVQPWHDTRYLSIKAALNYDGVADGIDVDAIDKNRFETMVKRPDASNS